MTLRLRSSQPLASHCGRCTVPDILSRLSTRLPAFLRSPLATWVVPGAAWLLLFATSHPEGATSVGSEIGERLGQSSVFMLAAYALAALALRW